MQELAITLGSFILGVIVGDALHLELKIRLKDAVEWLKNRKK